MTSNSPGVRNRGVWAPGEGGAAPRLDPVTVEAPLEIRVAGEPIVVVMRTPGHDRELAVGMALAEGWATVAAEIEVTRPPAAELHPEEVGNVVELALPGGLRPKARRVASSSCGVCGKQAIADLELRASPVSSAIVVSAQTVSGLPEALRAEQHDFEQTGGVHAAGLFGAGGDRLCIREDVGRHNAVDKVLGWAAHAALDPSDLVLCVSGRVSFEIVQKVVVASVPIIAAVSAPSTLAIDVAERFRITLCGFVRGPGFNVYSHSTRISSQ